MLLVWMDMLIEAFQKTSKKQRKMHLRKAAICFNRLKTKVGLLLVSTETYLGKGLQGNKRLTTIKNKSYSSARSSW